MSSASPLASGTFVPGLQMWPSFLLRGGACSSASNPALSLTGWATLSTAHFISQGLGGPSVKWGNNGTNPIVSITAHGVFMWAAVTGTLGAQFGDGEWNGDGTGGKWQVQR